MNEKCIAPHCEREVEIKKHGLCRTHYVRYRNTGTVGTKPINASRSLAPYNQSKAEAKTA